MKRKAPSYYEKLFKKIFLVSSSSRWHRKSGKQAGNHAVGVDGACLLFRKPDTDQMKSRKSGEFSRVGSPLAHGLHRRPRKACGKQRRRVQSAAESKPGARFVDPGFAHGIHPGASPIPMRRKRIALIRRMGKRSRDARCSGEFFPKFPDGGRPRRAAR